MNQKSEKMTAFTWFTEIIFWIKTFLSPFLGGVLIGAICYFYIESILGSYLFWVFTCAGFLGGVVLATYIWKTQGTANFQGKILATPDLEQLNNHQIPPKDKNCV